VPRKFEIDALHAETAALKAILEEAREVGDVVGELQSEERLEEIQQEISMLAGARATFANVALFFAGEPVYGSRGIAAQFAGKVLDIYQELVSKTFARLELGSLGSRGRIPFKKETDLMVTGLAHGSFGFVLEEFSDQEELHDTELKEVISVVSNLLGNITSIDDSDFENIVTELDQRSLIALREFFKELDSASATFRVVDDLREYSFDSQAIQRGRIRTESTEIEERASVIRGRLKGFLPDHKKFELIKLSGETIYGTATKEACKQFDQAVGDGLAVLGTDCAAEFIVSEILKLNQEPKYSYRLVEFKELGI
jgi:hypothetical protein